MNTKLGGVLIIFSFISLTAMEEIAMAEVLHATRRGWEKTTVVESFPDLGGYDPENKARVYVKRNCKEEEKKWIHALIIRHGMQDKIGITMTWIPPQSPKIYLSIAPEVHEEFKTKSGFVLEKSKL